MADLSRRDLLSSAAGGLVAVTTGGGLRRRRTRVSAHQQDIDPPEEKGFTPEQHAFGFRNWGAGNGISFDTQHDHERISETEAAAVVERWQAQVPALNASGERAESIARNVYEGVNGRSGTNGHCFGMIYAAQQYHRDPDSIPVPATRASDIPKPTGEYAPVGDDIDRYHNEQFLDFDCWWTGPLLRLPRELAPIDYGVQQSRIQTAIDEGETIGLGLGNSLQDAIHVVLAYDYEPTTDGIRVAVYDPNYRASDFRDGRATGSVRFKTAGRTVRVATSGGFRRVMTLPQTREVDASRFLAEGLETDLRTTLSFLFDWANATV